MLMTPEGHLRGLTASNVGSSSTFCAKQSRPHPPYATPTPAALLGIDAGNPAGTRPMHRSELDLAASCR